jgi:transcriptional regulator with XRE-family HTH domain
MSKLFDKALKQVPKETKSFVDNSFNIVDQIHAVLVKQGKNQKDLAILLGKKESEISKWMQGTHNFTLKSISKIEAVLDDKIITTPLKSTARLATKLIPVHVHVTPQPKPKVPNKWAVAHVPNLFQGGLKTA